MLLHDQKVSLATKGVSYRVTPNESTRDAYAFDRTVSFVAESAGDTAFRLHDFFTPEQADEMAAAFSEVARRARTVNGIEVPAVAELDRSYRQSLADRLAAIESALIEPVRAETLPEYVFATAAALAAVILELRGVTEQPAPADPDPNAGLNLPPIFAEMQAIIDATPDRGEGSRFDSRSTYAWEMVELYRTADEADTIAEFIDAITTGVQVRRCVIADVKRTVDRWRAEDAPTAEAA